MQLNKSSVIFNPENHTYTLNGVALSGITGMIQRQLFPDKYKAVPEYILNRAAERGSMIHEICELVDDMGINHKSDEAQSYMLLKDANNLNYECSEYLVSDNKHFASCIDKVYRVNDNTFILGDIKTTYKLDREYLVWQLSIYAYLFERQNPGAKIEYLFGIWLRGTISELVEVERVPDEVVIDLLTCEVEGRQFVNPYKNEHKTTLPAEYLSIEESIAEIETNCKYWADKKKQLIDGVMKEMVKAGVYKWEGDTISFTRKKDSIRKTFDKEAFERDYPGIYEKYMKESPVIGSVTLKVS